MNHSILSTLVLSAILFCSIASAETRYVTDQFEVTMRSGASTSNSILAMLKSGQPVRVLEQDNESKYSLIETANGKQGYVLSRFLDNEPSGRERVQKLKVQSEKQQARINDLSTQLQQLKMGKSEDTNTIQTLQQNLNDARSELTDLQEATRDTVRVLKQNEGLQLRINELDASIKRLTTENAQYKDKTAMDWFIRGASVSLIAFLLGILVTRIRWKKRDSWGNY